MAQTRRHKCCFLCLLIVLAIFGALGFLIAGLKIDNWITIYRQPNEKCGERPGFKESLENLLYEQTGQKWTAKPGEFPWMAKIVSTNLSNNALHYSHCTATLISHKYALTAGHCLTHNYSFRAIIFGKTSIDQEYGTLLSLMSSINFLGVFFPDIREIRPENVIFHPEFRLFSNEKGDDAVNDLAIIELDPPLPFSDLIQPICLASSDHPSMTLGYVEPYAGGWGNFQNQTLSSDFRVGKTLLWPQKECEQLYHKPGVMCLGKEKTSKLRKGDSGGPIMTKDVSYRLSGNYGKVMTFGMTSEERFFQIGVHSFSSVGENKETLVSGATRISKYCDFIDANTDVKCKKYGMDEALEDM